MHDSWLTFDHYAQRNRWLLQIGFDSYKAYLLSEQWQAIRARVLAGECAGCWRFANQAHHSYYSPANLSGESLDGLHGLCDSCHEYIEFGRNKTKLTPTEVEMRLQKLIARKCGKSVKLKEKDRLKHIFER